MKEASSHITNPIVQHKSQPFFQRSMEEGKEDSAFFSGVQAKLTVGQKDDPYEKEADSMADKVVNRPASNIDTVPSPADNTISTLQKKATPAVQKIAYSDTSTISTGDQHEEKHEEKNEPDLQNSIQKSPVADDGQNNQPVQRMCRECDEGDVVYRSADGSPDIAGMSKRDAVIATAKTMLGKIKAKQTQGSQRYGADQLWEIFKLAAPGVWSEDVVRNPGPGLPSWCGIFAVWAHKKAGIDVGNWQMGKGVSAFSTLKPTTSPEPGDIGYIDQPFQHHCIVTKVGANIESIDGNSGLFSEVIENTRPKTAYTGFFTAFSGSSGGSVSKKEIDGSLQKNENGASSQAPSSVETSLTSSKGGGTGLPEKTRSEMESGFGADFSNVKIHTDSTAAQMNKQLNAQAFAHGSDVYFSENKFNPETSSGKHLLAHELTHTVQQGAAPTLQKKSLKQGIQKKEATISPLIQRDPASAPEPAAGAAIAPAATPDDEKKIKDAEKQEAQIKNVGLVRVNGSSFEIQLFNFPLKQYANLTSYFEPMLTPADNPSPIEAPKPKTRKTNQGELWRNGVREWVREALKNKILPKGLENEAELELSLTGKGKAGAQNTKIVGTFDELAEQAMVPFWDNGGHPQVHEIEHKVDWQILGDKADTIDNLCLLDKPSNGYLGRKVSGDIKSRIEKVLDFYIKQVKVSNLVQHASAARKNYKVTFMSFKTSQTKTRSIIGHMNLKPTAGLTPITTDNVQIKKFSLPKDHIVFKTAKSGSGTGFILPYDFKSKNEKLVMKGEYVTQDGKKVYELKTITITRMVRDDKGVALGYEEDITVGFTKGDKPDHYNMDQKGWAYAMKNRLRLAALSPVVLEDDPELDPHNGVTAKGKVVSDVSFLQGANIEFGIKDSEFFIGTTIDADFLKGNKKIPKPFSIDYGSVTIEASSAEGLSVAGMVGFGIEKLGKGSVKVGVNSKGFNAAGDFQFDKSIFDGSINFKYENKKWTIGGKASMNGKKVKGIEKADISFEYSEETKTLSVTGSALLKVPGISKITIDSKIGEDGDFEVSADVDLEKIPKRIKGGHVTAKISKNKESDGDWDLSILGNVEPDIEYNGLAIKEVKVSFQKGIFDIAVSASYERNRIKATEIMIGLTNKPVSADGKTATGEGTSNMNFYGAVKLAVKITDELEGDIDAALKPDGDITLDGKIELKEDKELFKLDGINQPIFDVEKNIPIASCVVVTLSFHIGGKITLYADIQPLMIKKGSNVSIGHLSLRDFSEPQINSNIVLGSHLSAGAKVVLAVGLTASLLGLINAEVGGEATVDFVALDADLTGVLDVGWAPGAGLKINEASISMEMKSKLKAKLDATAKVYVDLWLTTITVWDHKWPVTEDEFPIHIFGDGKKTWKLPIGGSGNKLNQPDVKGNLDDVNKKATPEEVEKRTLNKAEGKGQTDEDKQGEINELTKKEVLSNFRNPDRLIFDKSTNYLEIRYGLYDYLKAKAGLDKNIDLNYIDEEIRKAEFEEYDAFSFYIIDEKDFDDNSKAIAIEDFIVNHPTLGSAEINNLRSLVPAKAPPSGLAPVKTRGSQIPKKTPDPKQSASKKPIQKKAKEGLSSAKKIKQKNTGRNKAEGKPNVETNETVFDDGTTEESTSAFAEDIGDNWQEIESTKALELEEMGGFSEELHNHHNNKPFYMRPFSRTRKPLQQQATEKNNSPFFSGPQKKEKANGTSFFQAKLNVGQADDPLEKEADKVADAVTGKGEKKEDRKDDIAKGAGVGKPEQEANKGKSQGADKPPMQEEKKEKGAVQKKGKETDEKEEKGKKVDKKDNPSNTAPAKAKSVEASIADKNGRGNQLPANALNDMQSSFNKDFSDVRIHTDDEAAELSNELDAHAFTTGKDIYFNNGKFDPESESGKHLLAHELTHVVQQNKDTIRRDPKSEKEEKTRAQTVRDNYQKALHAKTVKWEEVASYFNAFNEAEQRSKMAQLTGQQLFLLHQAAAYSSSGGPRSAAALITSPVPGMDSSIAASIEEQILQYNYQQAIDLMTEDLDKKGVIDRTLLSGGKFTYLAKEHMSGEGRVMAPGFEKTGKAKPTSSNISSDAFGQSKGLPFLYSTLIHEFQHVHQMQKKDESKALIPDQGNDEATHLQQEVEAYGTELVHAKESGFFNNTEEMDNTWTRLQKRWQELSDDRKKSLNDLYKKAYAVVKEAVGKNSFLLYTPVK